MGLQLAHPGDDGPCEPFFGAVHFLCSGQQAADTEIKALLEIGQLPRLCRSDIIEASLQKCDDRSGSRFASIEDRGNAYLLAITTCGHDQQYGQAQCDQALHAMPDLRVTSGRLLRRQCLVPIG